MAFECEAKIRVADFTPLRERLSRLGADDHGTRLERNYVLDNAKRALKRRGVLLRIRNTGGPGALLTVKNPVEGGEFKTREEIETRADDTDSLLRQFRALGYRVDWIYEKVRQSWRWGKCEIVLDQCPEIGLFVEIEGNPDDIRAAAAELGLNADDHIADNYLGLWAKYLKSRGEKRRDMIFTEEEKAGFVLSCPQ